jgi:transmembrane sensor
MLKQNELNKIERFIEGQADDDEKEYIDSLFLSGETNSTLRNLLEKDWNSMLCDSTLSEVNLNHLLDRVHHIILRNELSKRQKPLHRMIRIYRKVAAILFLPVLIIGGIVYSYLMYQDKSRSDHQGCFSIYAPLGSRVSFDLPDGTSGMLNSGSHLSYSLPFTNNRRVKLEGEAWFEVSRDEEHPFEISAGNSSVKVLGTSFNISAYPDENYLEVVLQKGKLEFQDNISDEKITLFPSERLVSQNGIFSKSVSDPKKYNVWTEGKLVFRGDPMSEVGRRIERWYNVKIELADKEIEKYSFRATFEDDKLEEVLRLLSLTSPIRYNITPRKLLGDGTYEKEKVIIYMKK